MTDILKIKDLTKHYVQKSPFLKKETGRANVLNGINLTIKENEISGLIGESGCGKSTIAKLIMMLEESSSGTISFRGEDINSVTGRGKKNYYKNVQMIFQDPYSSLNPRMKVKNIIGEMIRINGGSKRDALLKTKEMLCETGLEESAMDKYPHEFSGGQRQRIAIARALVVRPKLLIADEPVSALDLALQYKIIDLLLTLKAKYKFSILYISHDLNSVAKFCDNVSVMYLGKIMEKAGADKLLKEGKHPYLKALIDSIPIKDPLHRTDKKSVIKGEIPGPHNIPVGCPFHPRCPERIDVCDQEIPVLKGINSDHAVSCHLF
ncbi:MAG: ABC transporter ATP-binding protein [Deltaproteobacteria bacterium]|nr:ABC transporter ATP-binding protein [Deltaproteobacteria bacterium]